MKLSTLKFCLMFMGALWAPVVFPCAQLANLRRSGLTPQIAEEHPFTTEVGQKLIAFVFNQQNVHPSRLWETYRPAGYQPYTEKSGPAPWTGAEREEIKKKIAKPSLDEGPRKLGRVANLLDAEHRTLHAAFHSAFERGAASSTNPRRVAEQERVKELIKIQLGKYAELSETFYLHEMPTGAKKAIAAQYLSLVELWAKAHEVRYRTLDAGEVGKVIEFYPDSKHFSEFFARLKKRTPKDFAKMSVRTNGRLIFETGTLIATDDAHHVYLPPQFFLGPGVEPMTEKVLRMATFGLQQLKPGWRPYGLVFQPGSPLRSGERIDPGNGIWNDSLFSTRIWLDSAVKLFNSAETSPAKLSVAKRIVEYAGKMFVQFRNMRDASDGTVDLLDTFLVPLAKADGNLDNWHLENIRTQADKDIFPVALNRDAKVFLNIYQRQGGIALNLGNADGFRVYKRIASPPPELWGLIERNTREGAGGEIIPTDKTMLLDLIRHLKRDAIITEGLAERYQNAGQEVVLRGNEYLKHPGSETAAALVSALESAEAADSKWVTLRSAKQEKEAPLVVDDYAHRLNERAVQTGKLSASDSARIESAPAGQRKHVVEKIGEDFTERFFLKHGWRIRPHGPDNPGYDFKVSPKAKGKEYFVEIKAISESNDTVFISRDELEFARAHPEEWTLAVVRLAADGTTQLFFFREMDLSPVPKGKSRPYLLADLLKTPAATPLVALPGPGGSSILP